MGLLDWFRGGAPPRPEALAVSPDSPVVPDLSDFQRASWSTMTSPQLVTLISAVEGLIGSSTLPHEVPLSILEVMGCDPVIYLGEAALTAPVRDPDLYYVRHPDPAVRAETEEWLWPLLPGLLPAIARSCAYGSIPYVLDWRVQDLRITVRREGAKPRNKRLSEHVHYGRSHELWPGNVELLVANDDLVGLRHGSKEYGPDRAFVSVCDRQFGTWVGQGSRRRAYKAWYLGEMIQLWESRWLERSVDPPRIGYAPKGTIQIDGTTHPATKLLTMALMSLKGGGSTTLPAARDENGNRVWEVNVLDMPDRSEVWSKALGRQDGKKLLASLVPPVAVGGQEATLSGGRVPAQFFVEAVQGVANYVAQEVAKVVAVVHAVNHGDRIAPPEVLAYDIPAAKRKLLLEVFKAVQGTVRHLEDGRTVTLGEQISDEVIDQLGLPKREVDEAAHKPAAPPPGLPGRPRDATGDREERREHGSTDEGEDATGGPNESPEAE